MQRWIDVVDSIRRCWNVDLGDDFWKLFVTLLIVGVRLQVLDLLDVVAVLAMASLISSFYLVSYARVLCSSLEGYMHG